VKYRILFEYSAIDPSGDAEGSSKAWKVTSDSTYSAIEKSLALFKDYLAKSFSPTAIPTNIKIDCELMEDPEATYRRIVKDSDTP